MHALAYGTNVAVFLIFFGIALIQALQEGHWSIVVFWLLVGAFFLRADIVRERHHSES